MKCKTSPTESRFRCQRNPAPVREADHTYGWHHQLLAALVHLATTPPATGPDQPLPTTRRVNRSSSVYITIPGWSTSNVIVNYHQRATDRPVRLIGASPVQVFRNHFDAAWLEAKPLELVLADQIIAHAGPSPDLTAVACAAADIAAGLNLGPHIQERVFAHLAFRHSCPVIFIVGLPGAGKSLVRRLLADRLRQLGIDTYQLPDYVFAYRDYLHGLIQLHPMRGAGFQPNPGGAFAIRDETALMPALHALAKVVRESVKDHQVTLVEFARVDLMNALQE